MPSRDSLIGALLTATGTPLIRIGPTVRLSTVATAP